jgi:type II secretory pathway pseudopilin PulG
MTRRSNKRSRCWRATALTLIEVVAGLAILGTLLVAVLLAEARCRRQSAGARGRLAACRAAEAMLQQWWDDPRTFPRAGQGEVKGNEPFLWKTSVVENEQAERLGAQVVRLEVFQQDGSSMEKPAVTVDVVLPAQDEPKVRGLHAD